MDIEKIEALTNELEQTKERYKKLIGLLHFVERDEIRFQLGKFINNSNKPFWDNAECILASLEFDYQGEVKKDEIGEPIQQGLFKGWFYDFKDFLLLAIKREIDDCELRANQILKDLKE